MWYLFLEEETQGDNQSLSECGTLMDNLFLALESDLSKG